MTNTSPNHNQEPLSLDALIRFSLVLLLCLFCFEVLSPFVVPVIWGLIIAVALNPLYQRLVDKAAGKKGLVAALLVIIFIAALVVPTGLMVNGSVNSLEQPIAQIQAGTYQVPELPEKIANWPLIGKPLNEFSQLAQNSLSEALATYDTQAKAIAEYAGNMVAGFFGGILQSIFSLIIAALFWTHSAVLLSGLQHLSKALLGNDGPQYLNLCSKTIRSVAQGVIGVAAIQAIASAAGMMLAGVPGAGLWALLVLIVAVAQLPPIIVLGPVAAWLYSGDSSLVATLFLIWSIIVSVSDAFLKPLLLGRGVEVPMIIILMGAIGGMLYLGILGLFTGAVVLAVAYKLAQTWVLNDSGSTSHT